MAGLNYLTSKYFCKRLQYWVVGRTLLSAAFDVDLDFLIFGPREVVQTSKVEIKSGGQECPPHTEFLAAGNR